MLFSGMEDRHDRKTQELMAKHDLGPAEIANFNLVGIRRRLNNIEMGVWLLVALATAHVWRHWG